MRVTGSSSTVSSEVDAYLAERNRYKEQNQQRTKKGSAREAETLKMLAAFQSKMEKSRKLAEYVSAGVADDDDGDDESEKQEGDDNDDDDGADNLGWLVCAMCRKLNSRFLSVLYVSVVKIQILVHDFGVFFY